VVIRIGYLTPCRRLSATSVPTPFIARATVAVAGLASVEVVAVAAEGQAAVAVAAASAAVAGRAAEAVTRCDERIICLTGRLQSKALPSC